MLSRFCVTLQGCHSRSETAVAHASGLVTQGLVLNLMSSVDNAIEAVRRIMTLPARRLRVYFFDEDKAYLPDQRYLDKSPGQNSDRHGITQGTASTPSPPQATKYPTPQPSPQHRAKP